MRCRNAGEARACGGWESNEEPDADRMQMVDVHLPTTDGCQLILPRYTQPNPTPIINSSSNNLR